MVESSFSDELFLGLETSCDETSVAVLRGDGSVVSNLVSSQIALHAPFGGVVPEIAARAHLAVLPTLLDGAREALGGSFQGLTAVAATAGPGLVGALLVGLHAGEGIATGLDVPFYPVNHLEGHLYSPFLRPGGEPMQTIPFPFLGVVVSGGHSAIYRVDEGFRVTRLARTRDDAAGEAYDKVGKICGLAYPGGPVVDALAATGDPAKFDLPRPRFDDGTLDFSFSGLKTAVLRRLQAMGWPSPPPKGSVEEPPPREVVDLLAGFQEAVIDSIETRIEEARRKVRPRAIAISGGVAANRGLRSRMASFSERNGLPVLFPTGILAADNGAMIALAGALRYHRGLAPGPARAVSRWDPAS
jgi:N6-L-threonylcarbamoyladenine synthase